MSLAPLASASLRQRTDGFGIIAPEDDTSPAAYRAARHAWLALEIALAGPSLWEQLDNSLPPDRGSIFRQQLAALLDLLGAAGLGCDDPDVSRRCREELRAARQAGVLDREGLEQFAADLRRAGYPHLAHLVGLRAPWDEPLFLGVLGYFQRRGDPGPGASEGPWRCLEMTAGLLESRAEEVEALLDRPEPGAGAAAASGGDFEAIDRLSDLGMRLCRRGDYQGAAAQFTAALKLGPANALLYCQRGDAYRLLCEYERAIADFHVALRLSPSAPGALVSRAVAYHLSGEHDRAVADCSAAIALSPDDPAAYRTRAAAYAELGADDDALADLTAAMALAPEDDEAPFQRGTLHARRRDFAAAVADFDRALELSPYHVAALLHRGHAHRRQGNYGQAIRDYGDVLRHHPDNALAYSGRGQARQLNGDLDRALADFTEALRLGPDSARDYYHRGTLYRARGDLRRAVADLDEAIRRQPKNWAALYYRGKALLAQGQYALALLDLTEVVGLSPTLLPAYLSRALAYDRLGRYAEGIADATRAVELDAASPAAYLVRGALHAHQGDRAAAIDDLTRATQFDECFALAYHERGLAYTLEGDYDRALADCDRLIALEPSNAQAYASRSIVYHFKGEVERALADYARALQLGPRCFLSGWDQGLAEAARGRAIQRLADYIDGLRPEAPASEPPPPAELRIVLKPAGADVPAPPRPERPASRAPEKRPEEAAPPAPTAETVSLKTRAEATAPELPAGAKPQTMGAPLPDKVRPRKQELAPGPKVDEGTAAPIPRAPVRIADDKQRSRPPSAPELSRPTQGPRGADKKVGPRRVSPAPAVAIPTTCPNCLKQTTPAALPEGRGRCGHCQSVFPLWESARPPARKKAGKARPRAAWAKRLPVAAGAAVGLLLFLVVFRSNLFGNSDRARVYPAQGKALWEGKPLANASIFLHPVEAKSPHVPRPRAVVREDGIFVLGTYRQDDGAPAGEYRVTVQWFNKANGRDVPANVLPARYAAPETSGLTVRIQEGDNQLPPIQLTRRGTR